MLNEFYTPFHETVVKASTEKDRKRVGERILGTDPKSGKQISVKIGRYGAMAQIGTSDDDEKPRFAALRADQSIETITLEEALQLFAPPKNFGTFEGYEITYGSGRFGPYLKHNGLYYSIKKTENVDDIDNKKAIEIILNKRETDAQKIIKTFEENADIKILRGRFGPYISYQKKNYKIPKTQDPEELSIESCFEIINKQDSAKKTEKSKTTKTTKTKKGTSKK